jgi:hypothetical protein
MPLDCYFRRENNQKCDITYEYTDNVFALAVVPFWDRFRFVFLQYLWSPDHDLHDLQYQDLPHIVRQLNSFPDRSRPFDICCTVWLGWSSQKIQTPAQTGGFAPEGKQGGRCECYLLK